MEKQLDRRQNEKIMNILNEIKDVFISAKNPISLPLLGGLALKAQKEGIAGPELSQTIDKRIWAFQFIENKGIINNLKLPRKDNLNGEFKFQVDEKKFDNFYKSCGKSYNSKAKAYQQRNAEEKGQEQKVNPEDSGSYFEEKGNGYLEFKERKVEIGKIDSRKSKLVKTLWHPDHFGQTLTLASIFEEIIIDKDRKRQSLRGGATVEDEKYEIIKNAKIEIQKILRRESIKNFSFSMKKRELCVKLKIPKG